MSDFEKSSSVRWYIGCDDGRIEIIVMLSTGAIVFQTKLHLSEACTLSGALSEAVAMEIDGVVFESQKPIADEDEFN